MQRSLGVVVPIFEVEDYLPACLDSLLAQTRRPDQVVLVDDGSTDASGRIADRYAAAHEGWTVLHVPNGGLGRARNLGADALDTDYLAFVDSDDLVPERAYALLLEHLEESGSDLAAGAVMRYDGTGLLRSPLHERFARTTRIGTHITELPELLYDTTAWNKLYRTDFWRRERLRFPEGVLYEDIPVTIPAHFLARSVDVVAEPVYWWRERQTATPSITQRRGEVRNLVDRMAAIDAVDRFLVARGLDEDKRRHDRKILTLDLRLYLLALLEADDAFRRTFVDLAGSFVRQTDEAVLRGLDPIARLQWWLVGQSRLDAVLEVLEQQVTRLLDRTVQRRPLRLTTNLPYRGDRALRVPGWVYDVTNTQPMRAQLDDVTWDGDTLQLRGHAFVEQVPMTSPRTSRLRVEARDRATGQRRWLPVRRMPDVEQTGRTRSTPTSYAWCGFTAPLDAGALPAERVERVTRYHLIAHLTTLSARRGRGIGTSRGGRASTPGRRLLADGTLGVAGWNRLGFELVLHRDPTYLARAEAEPDGTLALHLRLGDPETVAASAGRLHLVLERPGAEPVRIPVGPGPDVRVPLPPGVLAARRTGVSSAEWACVLEVDGERGPLPAGPDVGEVAVADPLGEVAVEVGTDGGVRLHAAPVTPRVDEIAVQDGHLVLRGPVMRGGDAEVILAGRVVTVRYPAQDDGPGRWLARVPLDGPAGSTALRRLRSGRYWLRCPDPVAPGESRGVRVTQAAAARPTLDVTAGGVRVEVSWTRNAYLMVAVDPWGPWTERGAVHRARNAGPVYAVARRGPRGDHVLFEAWKGKQYSDSPRAVFEELRARGDGRRAVWAVAHHGVEVPDDVETVLRFSADYYRLLGSAAAVVTNDSLDPSFRKRPGSVYLQTWHGTPLKRIGHDMGTIRFANVRYLEEFDRDVAAWDLLVSPNPFCSSVLPRAFGYVGTVLDSGYPRNDVFHDPVAAAARTAAARARLGLEPGRSVVLYAPTWRDTRYDASGRYAFHLRLDLERLRADLGDEAVLLLRGHQLVADSMARTPYPDFVRDVSHHPDITDLYLVADVLVTDYSSTMFDYANTGRPMVFFAYDLEQYRDELRGFYLDYLTEVPGPVATTPREASERIADAVRSPAAQARAFGARYDAFRRAYCGWEDGKASARVVDALLGRVEDTR